MPDPPARGLSLSRRSLTTVRVVLALIVAALAAAFGALLLGEYPFSGATPWVAGVLFGYVVGEIAVSLGRRRNLVVGLVCSVVSAGALLWAAWISSGDGKQRYAAMAWVAAGLAFVVALARAGPRLRATRRGTHRP